MTSLRLSPLSVAGAATLAIACALLAGKALWMLATPVDFETRRGALETRIARLEASAGQADRPSAFGPGALCPTSDATGVEGVRQAFALAAAQSSVTLTDLTAARADGADLRQRIAPIDLRIQGEGGSDAVFALLHRLSRGAPELFVDRLDLVAKPPNVTMKLSGRVFCWTSAGS